MRSLRICTFVAAWLVMTCLTAVAQPSTAASPPAVHETTKPVPSKSVKSNLTSVVNINTGTAAELTSLPQIGKVRSAKIIAARPYKTTDDLVGKKVISQKLFDKLKARLTV